MNESEVLEVLRSTFFFVPCIVVLFVVWITTLWIDESNRSESNRAKVRYSCQTRRILQKSRVFLPVCVEFYARMEEKYGILARHVELYVKTSELRRCCLSSSGIIFLEHRLSTHRAPIIVSIFLSVWCDVVWKYLSSIHLSFLVRRSMMDDDWWSSWQRSFHNKNILQSTFVLLLLQYL
jgi:hypothetical protein